jgi:DNA polymerase-3 subunit epsilon
VTEFEGLFSKYDRLVFFDTETTGLQYSRDEIIEFAAVVVEQRDGKAQIVQEYDELITLSPGSFVPPVIQNLTGITDQDIRERGIPKTRVCRDIAQMVAGNTLLLAYNAHFDLSFLFYMLMRDGDPAILKGKDKIDLLTVYKDRRSYPHKLANAIEAYSLQDQVVNSHRAVDDVIATVAVTRAMDAERSDLERYVNLFGYNPKFGVDGKKISSITYKPQPYDPPRPLYDDRCVSHYKL